VQIAPGLHRLGNGTINAYLVADGSEVTIVDAGLPGYWGDLPAELAAMGRTLDDVRAMVLTHGHSDHIGFAERFRPSAALPRSTSLTPRWPVAR
jgi:glyoxylase-like metal-dependent hydrolase (beta-lactamase superfamily II)